MNTKYKMPQKLTGNNEDASIIKTNKIYTKPAEVVIFSFCDS